ncbi:hypothetical protein Tco_0699379 [Tanacetum coccineum]
MGTMWCLYDPTPFDWYQTDAHSKDFGKERDCVYFKFPFAIKLAIGLNIFLRDPSPLSWNDPRDFAKLVNTISLPQDVPYASDRHLIEQENQVQRLMEAHLASKSSVQVNKIRSSCEFVMVPTTLNIAWKILSKLSLIMHPRVTTKWEKEDCLVLEAQLKQQQDEVINKINTLWKVILDKFDDVPTRDITKNSTAHMNVISHNHQENGEPLNKGIKSPSKLLSPKYQAQSTLGKEDINSYSLKRVYFINTITIIRKEDEPKETRILKPKATNSNDHNTTVEDEETVEKELRNSKTVAEEGKPSDIGHNDETRNLEDRAYEDERK